MKLKHETDLTVPEMKRIKSIIEWTMAACQYTSEDLEVIDSVLYKLRSKIKESSSGDRRE